MPTNSLSGNNFIGGRASANGDATFTAFSVAKQADLPTEFHIATPGEIEAACEAAQLALREFSQMSGRRRGEFLRAIADEIVALGEDLIERASAESSLPLARLQGERGRTVGQLQMFAKIAEEGEAWDARIETADNDRQPLRKPDCRRVKHAIGPVAVFGASNFPLAFSVAGGDTASALAAGCPVVVKAHPAHPGTSEMVASAILRAAETTKMPDGVFSMVHGGAVEGQALVTNPVIQAVGFTGSRRGGEALVSAGQSRPQPIPVFAEMGSINPVFLLPGALKDIPNLGALYAASLNLGAGQFCTNPGIVCGIATDDLSDWLASTGASLDEAPRQPMLTMGIWESYVDGCLNRNSSLPEDAMADEPGVARPMIQEVSLMEFLKNDSLAEELFGPAAVMVRCQDATQLCDLAERFEGQLTATIWMGQGDEQLAKELLSILSRRAGRVIINGFPTGVEVNSAMQHGGPYPATSDPRFTSVGGAAIERWLVPVCYQDVPDSLLPAPLQNANPEGISRLVNGTWTKESV